MFNLRVGPLHHPHTVASRSCGSPMRLMTGCTTNEVCKRDSLLDICDNPGLHSRLPGGVSTKLTHNIPITPKNRVRTGQTVESAQGF